MTEYERIPIETTEGHRPPSPAQDRLLVWLAAVALAAGLLIALVNVLGGDDPEVGIASPSPVASDAPPPTRRPTPSPRPRLEVAVQPGTPPSPEPVEEVFSGWIRANRDLEVRAAPDGSAVGILEAGAVAQAEESTELPPGEAGWLVVNASELSGWVATVEDGISVVQRYAQAAFGSSARIMEVAAGDLGFLAIGYSFMGPEGQRQMLLASRDGIRWEESRLPPSWARGWNQSVAWGPAGWLAAVVVDDSRRGTDVWIWQSADGRRWTSLGRFGDETANPWSARLVGSERGYLLALTDQATTLWLSTDGVNWRETDDTGLGQQGEIATAATPMGFYAWERNYAPGPAEATPQAAFSVDGSAWSLVDGGPGGPNRQVVGLGDRLLGIDADPATGAVRLWVGTLARGQLFWLRDTDGEAAFRDAAPASLIADGERAVAFGWDWATEAPLTWTLEPTGWTRSALPADNFGGIPRIAAAGPAGVVVVGGRPTLGAANPIFWHETAGGGWAPERSPIVEVVADPAPSECRVPPRDAVEFLVLDRVLATACFRSEPITFRAWAASCDGCYASTDAIAREAWLLGLTEEQLYLSPVEGDYWSWPAMVHPTLAYDSTWPGHWIEVTGHFDDPAAADCALTPAPGETWYYEGRRTLIDECRKQFVVTAVSVVSGP